MACHLLKHLRSFPDLELTVILLNEGRLARELRAAGLPVQVVDESRHSFPADRQCHPENPCSAPPGYPSFSPIQGKYPCLPGLQILSRRMPHRHPARSARNPRPIGFVDWEAYIEGQFLRSVPILQEGCRGLRGYPEIFSSMTSAFARSGLRSFITASKYLQPSAARRPMGPSSSVLRADFSRSRTTP